MQCWCMHEQEITDIHPLCEQAVEQLAFMSIAFYQPRVIYNIHSIKWLFLIPLIFLKFYLY